VVDFMGARVRTSSLWKRAQTFDGQVCAPPIPGDYHSEAVEWVGVLKSVRSAQNSYVAMELGAGLGPWLVAGGTGARSLGIANIQLYGIEGDPKHFELLQQNLEDNGFSSNAHALHAAIGASAGQAEWPIHEDPREDWGSRPIVTNATGTLVDYLGREFTNTSTIEVIAFSELLRREKRWDLVHIDIQGDEFRTCESASSQLDERVHWIVVGTHSRLIEGQLIDLFHRQGWDLENEKPCRMHYEKDAPAVEAMNYLDGVQVWRNPRLDQTKAQLR